MKLVIIESPYSGEVARNTKYAGDCCLDSISRGEAPIASHLLYPQFLDDGEPKERQLGIDCGLAWSRVADYHIFYTDHGWSKGMTQAKAHCIQHSIPYFERRLYPLPIKTQTKDDSQVAVLRILQKLFEKENYPWLAAAIKRELEEDN